MDEEKQPMDLTARRFERGNWVRYIPSHAHGDMHHPDCEDGVVKRQSEDGQIVFVLYDNAGLTMITGHEDFTAKATDYRDLKFMGRQRR